jgi:uncharacterized protein YbaP (TraB family)
MLSAMKTATACPAGRAIKAGFIASALSGCKRSGEAVRGASMMAGNHGETFMTLRWAARAFLLIGFLFTASWSLPTGAIQAAAPDTPGPAMWRLQADKATVYFLGSFHILPPSVTWRADPRIDTAMASADGVVFEVDLSLMDKPEVARTIISRATLPPGKTLRDVLSSATYAQLTRTAGTLSMSMTTLDRTKPWFAATGLLVGYMTKAGANPDDGVDSILTRETQAAGKPIIPLETIEEQFDVLDTLSVQDPDFLIMDTIRFVEEPDGLLARMLTAWRTGDAEQVDALMREDMDKYDGVYDRFIASRNAAWVSEIEALIRKGGTYFVVVGAGHLVGDKSVIAILRAKGYDVKRY